MTDITKCEGLRKSPFVFACPLRANCYRFTAPTSDHQSYFSRAPFTMTPGPDFKLSRTKNQWLAECVEFVENTSNGGSNG